MVLIVGMWLFFTGGRHFLVEKTEGKETAEVNRSVGNLCVQRTRLLHERVRYIVPCSDRMNFCYVVKIYDL